MKGQGFKIFDRIFYYPTVTPDDAIDVDPFRLVVKRVLDYEKMIAQDDVIFVYPSSVKRKYTLDLVASNSGRKIILVFCGENMYGYVKAIVHVYAALKKFIPGKYLDPLLFSSPILALLSSPSPLQVDTYFKKIVDEGQTNHFFILTNDLERENTRIFFAPYFYFFCQDRLRKINERRWTETKTRKFCAFIVSNPNNPDRINFYRKLSSYKEVDSFGKILNNKDPNDKGEDHVVYSVQRNDEIYEKYKFVICFENSYAKGYITEKLINAIAGGAVPIYRGAPDVANYFNTGRIINFDDFGSYDAMIERIKELDKNEDLYAEFARQDIFKGKDIIHEVNAHNSRLKEFINGIIE